MIFHETALTRESRDGLDYTLPMNRAAGSGAT
jgi:hypothetical protein